MGNFIFFLALLGALCNATLVASGPIDYYVKSTDPTKSDGGLQYETLQYETHYSDYNFVSNFEQRTPSELHMEQLKDLRQQLKDIRQQLEEQKKLIEQNNLKDIRQQLKELKPMQEPRLQEPRLQEPKLQEQRLQEQRLQEQRLQAQMEQIQTQVELRVKNLGENLQKNLRENLTFSNLTKLESCSGELFKSLSTLDAAVQEIREKLDQVYDRDSHTQKEIDTLAQLLNFIQTQSIQTTLNMEKLIAFSFNDEHEAKKFIQESHDDARSIMDGKLELEQGQRLGLERLGRQRQQEQGQEQERDRHDSYYEESLADHLDKFSTYGKSPNQLVFVQALDNGTRKTVGASRAILFPSGLFGFMIFTTLFISCVLYAMRSKQKQEDGRSRRKE